ncbi:MAG: 2-phospho-L-lactate transferase [Pseudomonadota bacterium]|nr:2-phospho-L-lactate transferase [Pseudomonadota bacterium]
MSRLIMLLTGGVGGAKLALGLYGLVPEGALSLIVNTGDDFDHLGLRICPDLDTALYTLCGCANPELGWGRTNESWSFMKALAELGGENWFRLGDGDLALHVLRTQRLAAGERLSDVTAAFVRALSVQAALHPMSDDAVATMVDSDEGALGFQDYFVRRRCEPRVRGLSFRGAERARLGEGARAALTAPELAAIVIAPSNPYLSIDPILAVPGVRDALVAAKAPVIAVTPIIAGQAVKGPTAKIMAELGLEPSPLAVAQHYDGLIDGFVLDARDATLEAQFSVPIAVTDTLMQSVQDKQRVARAVLDFAEQLAGRGR